MLTRVVTLSSEDCERVEAAARANNQITSGWIGSTLLATIAAHERGTLSAYLQSRFQGATYAHPEMPKLWREREAQMCQPLAWAGA